MARLVIGCELGKQPTAEKAVSALESWGAVRLLETLWLLSTKLDGRYVCSALQDIVEERDSVVVFELHERSRWSAAGGSEARTEWLRAHIGEHP